MAKYVYLTPTPTTVQHFGGSGNGYISERTVYFLYEKVGNPCVVVADNGQTLKHERLNKSEEEPVWYTREEIETN